MSRSAVRYDEKMKDMLARYKYRGDERLRLVLGGMLVHAYRQLQAARGGVGKHQVITYVPVSERRFEERGFNQAEQMAVELGCRIGIPVIPLLRRIRHTDKQSFKTRNDRLEDLEHVFGVDEAGIKACMERFQRGGALAIYIVDDVYTTGSTMHQCAKVLKSHLNADCYGITWAR